MLIKISITTTDFFQANYEQQILNGEKDIFSLKEF